MTISLIRMRTMVARLPSLARGLAVALTLSVILAFSPCCEVVSNAHAAEQAASPAAPDPHSASHSPETDGRGDICGHWLDNASAFAPIHDGALTPSWDGKAAIPSALGSYSFALLDPDAAIWRPLNSAPPPHALYLRFARLLL